MKLLIFKQDAIFQATKQHGESLYFPKAGHFLRRRFGAGRLGTAPFRRRTFGYSAVSVQDVWVQRRFGAGRLGTAPFRRRTFGYSAVSVQDVLARPTVEIGRAH